MTTPDFRAYVDRLLLHGNLGLAVAPRLDEAAQVPPPPDGALARPSDLSSGLQGDDGAFRVALGPGTKAWVQGQMHKTGADQAFDRTLDRMTDGQFRPGEIKMLEDRALTAARITDIPVMSGLSEGPPVLMNPRQKATVDRLMGQLGSDDLATRARSAYGKALGDGQIRIR